MILYDLEIIAEPHVIPIEAHDLTDHRSIVMNRAATNQDAAHQRAPAEALESIDHLYLGLMRQFFDHALENAARSTEMVFKVSSNFLSEPATNLLREFQSLYFSTGVLEKKKEDINHTVDDLFEQASVQLSKNLKEIVLSETESEEQDRLQLAQLQRRLEALVSIDANIRNHIVPAMSSMQFEDAVRQRLDHIVAGWSLLITALDAMDPDTEGLKDRLAELPSSVSESTPLYEIVLKRPPPQQGATADAMLFF